MSFDETIDFDAMTRETPVTPRATPSGSTSDRAGPEIQGTQDEGSFEDDLKEVSQQPPSLDGDIQDVRRWVERQELMERYRRIADRLEGQAKVVKADPADYKNVWASKAATLKKQRISTFNRQSTSIAESVPFIDPAFDSIFRFTPGQLVTVCGFTGEGKSTTASNIAATVIEAGKRAVIFSNEEMASDYVDHVSCLLERLPHKNYVSRELHVDEAENEKLIKRVLQRGDRLIDEQLLFVEDAETSSGGTCQDEYILEALKAYAKADVKPHAVIIDYLTGVYAAGSNGKENHYFELARFIFKLKTLVNTLPFPLVICAQMHSQDKKKGLNGKPAALDTRLVMGADVMRGSTVVVEVEPDFTASVTTMTVHKNRTYKTKGQIFLDFNYFGRYVPMTPDAYQAKVIQAKSIGQFKDPVGGSDAQQASDP